MTKEFKRLLLGLILVALILVIFKIIGGRRDGNFTIEQVLAELEQRLNDEYSGTEIYPFRIDSTVYKPPRTLQYYYSLIDMQADDESIDSLVQVFRAGVLETVSVDPFVHLFRDSMVVFEYHYFDMNGKFARSFILAPEEY